MLRSEVFQLKGRWRFLRQASLLSGSSGVSVLLSFVAFLLIARGLGTAQLGILATAQAYALVVHKLLGFQSWEMTIRYGTAHLGRDDDRLRNCLKLGFLSDGATALASALLGAVGVALVGRWQHWDAETRTLAYALCAGNLLNVGGTPTAVLRLYDRFGTLALQNLVASFTRLSACAAAFGFQGGVLAFGVASLCGDLAGNVFLLAACLLRLRTEGVRAIPSGNARKHVEENPTLLKFALSSYLNSTVRVSRELDVMIVAAVTSVSAAGIYKAGHKLASFFSVLTDPFYQVVYPELNRIALGGDVQGFRRTMRFGAMSAGLVTSAALLLGLAFGKPVIEHLLNLDFGNSFGVFAVCGVGWAIWAFSTPLAPALLALGKAPLALLVHAAAALLYLLLLLWLTTVAGALGAAGAFMAFNLIWGVFMLVALHSELKLWTRLLATTS